MEYVILGVIYCLLGALIGRIIYLLLPTKGKRIEVNGEGKAALVVIDVQEDTVRQSAYKHTPELMQKMNQLIEAAQRQQMEIIYIKQEYSILIDLILSHGTYKKGSKGAQLSDQLHVVNQRIYSKGKPDTFSNGQFDEDLRKLKINTLYIAGADAAACVYKTALGGLNRGYEVVAVEDAIFARNDRMLVKMMNRYQEKGIGRITVEEI